MTSTITFAKSGKWASFGGPSYDIKDETGRRFGSIIGGHCQRGGGLRSRGRKTRDYTVIVNGCHVGHVFTLERAKEIARRAVASIGYKASRQADGYIEVFDAAGVLVYECYSYYSVEAKFPSANKPV